MLHISGISLLRSSIERNTHTHMDICMDMFFHCASLLVGRGLASTTAFWASTRWPTTMPSQSFGVKVLGLQDAGA